MTKTRKFIIGISALSFLALFYFAYGLYINPKSPLGKAEYKKENTEVKVTYYRPFKKERLIFGSTSEGALVPFGNYWRLGANLRTKLKTNSSIIFANRLLKKGTYGLYVYPYQNNWVLTVHSNYRGWGNSEPEPEGIIMQVNLPTTSLMDPVEQLSIDFVEDALRIRWDTTQVVIPLGK